MPKLTNQHLAEWLKKLESAKDIKSIALYEFLFAEHQRRIKAGEKGGRPIKNKTKRAQQQREASARWREKRKNPTPNKYAASEIEVDYDTDFGA